MRRRLRSWRLRRALGGLALACAGALAAGLAVAPVAPAGTPLAAGAAPAAAAGDTLRVTPVGRVAFPERAYVVGRADGVPIGPAGVAVAEDGVPVRGLRVEPFGGAAAPAAVVLALDASLSMAGAPLRAAVEAARGFAGARGAGTGAGAGPGPGAGSVRIGVVAFNGKVRTLQAPTADAAALARALARPPALGYGTRIADALDHALDLLAADAAPAGAVVLLSDGRDVGSLRTVDDAAARAAAAGVRVFTVGLRSRVFDAAALRRLAALTGGAYAEATTPGALAAIYAGLGRRLAGEAVVRWRSAAEPGSVVRLRIAAGGAVRELTAAAPASPPAAAEPYRRSPLTRFLLSDVSLGALAVLVTLLLGGVAVLLLRGRQAPLVQRIGAMTGQGGRSGRGGPGGQDAGTGPAGAAARAAALRRAARSRAAGRRLAALARDLDIAGSRRSPQAVALAVLATAAVAIAVLAAVSPVLAVAGLLVPLGARALLARKVRAVRDAFADQLTTNLQVLASAMRSGHSLEGAFAVAVDGAAEPSRRELQRAIADVRLGVPLEDALRVVSVRMACRDLDQVALVAELQRTTGGNGAEVLDTVVETMRGRADVRRLVRTLTAQGRIARWILTGLPVAVFAFLQAIQPGLMRPLTHSGGGQVALLVAGLMVVAGSVVIQRIVEVEA